ncbi:MAG: phosphate acyltransferase PlsX [Bacillota bacterium]|jgi:glycerol-3-phosphate acyltransferase PlsX
MMPEKPERRNTIALDLMGGDYAPDAIIDGCITSLEKGTSILALGDERAVNLLQRRADYPNLKTLVCSQVITAGDAPVKAIRAKRDSTIVRGLMAVKNGEAGAFVSAGSTGALLAGGVLILKRAEGVDRPCLGIVLPSQSGRGVLFMDLGASSDVRPETLVKFGLMGKIYAERVLGWHEPSVGLLNIGSERDKGNTVIRKAYRLMEDAPLKFAGNIEARDVFFEKADIVITDGFTGNIFLKTCEGTVLFQVRAMKKEMKRNFSSKLGALLLRHAFDKVNQTLDYSSYGGAPMLGLEGCLVKCHGSSKSVAIDNGIQQALRFLIGDVASVISSTLSKKSLGESE